MDVPEETTIKEDTAIKKEIKYFECSNCLLREKYEYFGNEPEFFKKYKLLENMYVIEDPFQPSKLGEILILGAHCVVCNKTICQDTQCSIFYEKTYCIQCAKLQRKDFPKPVQDKLNKII